MTGTEGQDWANYQVAAPSLAGLGFVFVKATEGSSYVNPKHDAQVAHARSHGLVVGHYHFVRPGSMTAQADYFLAHAGAKAGDVLAFDWEDTGVSGAEKDAWLRHVQAKAPGHRVVLYCNRDFWLHRDSTSFAGDGLWIADPSAPKGAPRVQSPWLFHQYGSPGGLDRNYTPLTAAQLRAWANQQEDDMPTPEDLWAYHGKLGDKRDPRDAFAYLRDTNAVVRGQSAAITTLAGLVASGKDVATIVTAVEQAIANAVVHVQVDVTGDQPTP